MKTIQEMLQELSQCIVTVSGEFRFRTNWNGGGGKVPQPDLDTFDPNVPFCIENVGDVQAGVQYNTRNTNIKISKDYKTWNDYTSGTEIELNPKDRVYIKSDYVLDESATPKFNFTNANGTRLRARGNIASLLYGTGDEYITKYTIATQYCYNSMFDGCASLTQAPELPATTLADHCYYAMFSNCTSLTQAPALPATNLADYCYRSMFNGCASLTQVPELPATTLVDYCYDSMFQHCTSLTQAPVLPATTLANYCYESMFYGCTTLNQAPELPATVLVGNCYNGMFQGCTSLTQAPELPATTLASNCYGNMFSNCTGLTQAPELPATILVDSCYNAMFNGCTKLNYIKCLATNTSATNCTKDWLSNVSSTGTFECDNKKYFTLDSSNGIPVGWSITEINPAQPEPEKPDLDTFDPNVPFCIENVGDVPVEIGLYNTGKNTVRSNCKISTNLKTWSDYNLVLTDDDASNDIGRILLQNKGDRVYIKADSAPIGEYPPYPYPHTQFKVFNQSESKKIRARGNIASLNKGADDTYKTNYLILSGVDNYHYYKLFYNCTSLTQAPELPATTLATYCYSNMFSGCTSLTQAPELPATALKPNCYMSMFSGCTSLTQAPELPATKLARYCYQYMFTRCTALINAPKLPATEMQSSCYEDMFHGCVSLTQAPELPATIVKSYSYSNMFFSCTSLTRAPELPATTLGNSCYISMFYGCTSLTQAPELPAMTLANYCYRWMFYGCTSLTQAPELPATTLNENCYQGMFKYCTKLNYVKCLATDTSATDCTKDWLSGVSSTGTFECDNKKYFTIDSPNGIPTGWSITEINPDVEKPDLDTFDPNVPFCIENVGDVPVEIGMYNYTEAVRTNCEISYDLQTWQNYNLPITQDANSTTISKITLTNKGDRVYIKADLATNPGTFSIITVFNKSSTKKIRARGNIASLNKGANDAYKTDYLTTDSYCYANLFSDCGLSLTQAPDLPATTLNENCYQDMFRGCTQLVNAPELPATKLAYMCYSNMFKGCASLTQAPELPATTLSNYCYSGMFYGCTSLTQAPELPATTLSIVCYSNMFKGCTKLNYVKCLATDISAANCTASWLEGVSSTGDFYAPVTTRWTTDPYSGIPSGWTRHNIT